MTMAFACVDLRERKMYYLNAGHRNIYRIRDMSDDDSPGRSVLGFMEDFFSEVQEYDIQENDLLFFFTDGLTENTGPSGQHISGRRLVKLLNKQTQAENVVDLFRRRVRKCGKRAIGR